LNYLWWGKPEWKAKVLWVLVKGHKKMLANFIMEIGVAFVPKTWQNKQLPYVPLSHNNHKKDPWKQCCIH
jgi:hypothetical protein